MHGRASDEGLSGLISKQVASEAVDTFTAYAGGPREESERPRGPGGTHRSGPADGLVGDDNVGVGEVISELSLQQLIPSWLFSLHLLLHHLKKNGKSTCFSQPTSLIACAMQWQ